MRVSRWLLAAVVLIIGVAFTVLAAAPSHEEQASVKVQTRPVASVDKSFAELAAVEQYVKAVQAQQIVEYVQAVQEKEKSDAEAAAMAAQAEQMAREAEASRAAQSAPVVEAPASAPVSRGGGAHSDSWWRAISICEQGGRNDPFFGYFSIMDGSAGGLDWSVQVGMANAIIARAGDGAWAASCVAAGYAASPGG